MYGYCTNLQTLRKNIATSYKSYKIMLSENTEDQPNK